MADLTAILAHPTDILPIAWTVIVPVAVLGLAFKPPRLQPGDKLSLTVLLFGSWLITAGVISTGNSHLVTGDLGYVTSLVGALVIWAALHRMIRDLAWRRHWPLHLAVALFFTVFLLFVIAMNGFANSQHY